MISVIIPVYNHAKELRACVASLETQTEKNFELIIVDDASTDGGLDSRLRGNDKWDFSFFYIHLEKNIGAPAARNAGFAQSKGEYLLFLDADAELEPDALERFRKTLEAHPEAAFAYSSFSFGWKKFPCRPFDREALRQRNYIHTSALIRREAFPGFDESLKKFQDWDVWLTIAERGGVGIFIPEHLFRIGVRRRAGRMSDWLPSFMYKIPWPIFGYTPKAIQNYRTWEKVVKEKHKIPFSEDAFFDQRRLWERGILWFLGIVFFEFLSRLVIFHPTANGVVAVAIGLLIFVLTLRRPEASLLVLATEYITGSKGALFRYGGDAQNNGGISIREIMFAVFCFGWLIWSLQHKTYRAWKGLMRERGVYFVLAFFILYAIVTGWRQGNTRFLFVDANAWFAWMLLLPALDVVKRRLEELKGWIAPVFVSSLVWMALQSAGLLYFFSHGFAHVRDALYLWIRRTGVGEITDRGGGAFRVFFQSQVYFVFAAFAAWSAFAYKTVTQKRALFLFIIAAFGVLVSLSRSFWIGAVAGTLCLLVLVVKKKILPFVHTVSFGVFGGVVALVILSAVVLFPAPSIPVTAFTNLFSGRGDLREPAAMSRWELLPVLWNKIQEHPILGSGFGATVSYASVDPRTIAQFGSSYTTYAFEWGWLEHWIKFGILGIPLMVWILWSLGHRTWKSREPEWIKAAVVCSLVALGVLHFFTPYLNHPLGIVALIFGESLLVFYQTQLEKS